MRGFKLSFYECGVKRELIGMPADQQVPIHEFLAEMILLNEVHVQKMHIAGNLCPTNYVYNALLLVAAEIL